jgi:plasmid stabilization system protein ParE
MSMDVVITEQAEGEMESAYRWWATHRSKRQADRWYTGLASAIADLSDNPKRHAISRKRDRFPYEIRDLLFGLGSRPTRRAVFTIRGNQVVILTIRHVAREDLSPEDVANS